MRTLLFMLALSFCGPATFAEETIHRYDLDISIEASGALDARIRQIIGEQPYEIVWQSVYRFHADAPIPFSKSIRVTMEHGHANHRSDTFSTVAYWYQSEPHARFPALPPADARIPRASSSDATPAR